MEELVLLQKFVRNQTEQPYKTAYRLMECRSHN